MLVEYHRAFKTLAFETFLMESNASINSKLQNPSGQPPGAFEIVRIDFLKYLSPGAKIVPNLFVRGKISDRDFLHMDQT